jgi:hypothetical protein
MISSLLLALTVTLCQRPAYIGREGGPWSAWPIVRTLLIALIVGLGLLFCVWMFAILLHVPLR